MEIYIEDEKAEYVSVKDLLTDIYNYLDYSGCQVLPVATYYDKERTEKQCQRGRIRSFDDLHDIIKTYFPNMETVDIVHEIITFSPRATNEFQKNKNKRYYFYPYHCSDINRITVYYYQNKLSSGEYLNLKRYNSRFSWFELLALLGIHTWEELYDYIEENYKENETREIVVS